MCLLDSYQTIFLSWSLLLTAEEKKHFLRPQPSEHGSLVALKMALLCREAGFPPGLVSTHFGNDSSLDFFSFLKTFSYLLCRNFFASEHFRMIICLWNVYVSSFFTNSVCRTQPQVSVLPGGAETGKRLLEDYRVAMVTFSGSRGGPTPRLRKMGLTFADVFFVSLFLRSVPSFAHLLSFTSLFQTNKSATRSFRFFISVCR